MDSDAPKPPDHAFELRIDIGSNDWRRLLYELDRLAAHIETHGPECDMVSSFPSQVDIRRRDVSQDQYSKELQTWLQEYDRWRAEHPTPTEEI